MKHILIVFTLCASLFGCASHSDSHGDVAVIDIAANVGHADMGSLDDLFEAVEVMQPEFTDSSILNIADFEGIYGSRWYFSEERPQQMLITFDSSGRCLSSFSRIGQGPEDFGTSNYTAINLKNGNWYVNDIYGRQKMKSYTSNGDFVAASTYAFANVFSDPQGPLAYQKTAQNEKITLYRLDDKLNIVDSIMTPFISEGNQRLFGYPMGKCLSFEHNDSIYALQPDGTLALRAVMLLGNYKMPTLTDEQLYALTNEEIQAMNKKHFIPSRWSDDKTMLINYRYGDYNVFQAYDMATGKLVYSHKWERGGKVRIPLMADGKEMGVFPTGTWFDGSIIFKVPADDLDDDEANPIYIRAVSKR